MATAWPRRGRYHAASARKSHHWGMARSRAMPKPLPADPELLSTLSEPLRALAGKGEIRRYRRNTLLIEEGDFGDTLYIILAGRLRSYSSGDKGRESPTASTAPANTWAR